MASQLGFSEFKIDMDNNKNKSNNKRRNRTIKKKEKKTDKVQNLLNSMNEITSFDENTEGLANFNPPSNPTLTKQPDPVQESSIDNVISQESYQNLDNEPANQEYYKNYVPYYTQPSNNNNHVHSTKDDLMIKLNYMIQLLEESKEEKTDNVTEELVLYMFLGVFVIFVVDSFARAGKYTR